MMQAAKTARVGSHEHTAAVDAALAMAIGAAPGELNKAFDVKGRHTADIERRIAIAKSMQATSKDVWLSKPEYRQTFQGVVRNIESDDKIAIQLARSAGVPEQDIAAFNPETVIWVASNWMQNKNFDYKAAGLNPMAANVAASKWKTDGRPPLDK
jgi:hypothetical protein